MAKFEFEKNQFVNDTDYEYIANHLKGEQQFAAACSVIKYRQPDKLAIADPVPAIDLIDLETGATVNLGSKRDKPLVLFFGSYT